MSVSGEGGVMSLRQGQEEKKKPCDGHMGSWGQCSPHTHPLLGAVRTGKGIEEPALGHAKWSSGQGQPAETQAVTS